jgi:DNA-binding MarR family transcriptional regulator
MVQPLRLRNLANSPDDGLEPDRHGRLFDSAARARISRLAGRNDVEQLETLAALRLAASRVHGAMERWTESHGLSESRLGVLMALSQSPGHRCPLGELAEMLGVVPRTITDIVDVLERDGLIRRIPAPHDRRSVHAQLTKAGLDRMKAIRNDAVAEQTAIFASFKRDQLAELRHLCLLLVRQLDRTKAGS